jgi:PAS domain S-box-containing protein
MQNEQLRTTQGDLEQLHSKYLDLFQWAPLGYLTLDSKALITEANHTAAALLGVGLERLRGKRFEVHIRKDQCDTFYLSCKRAQSSLTAQVCLLPMQRADGTTLHAQVTIAPVSSDRDERPQLRIAMTDVTDRVRQEEQLVDYQKRLRSMACKLAMTAERERRCVARDLHDGICQLLVSSQMKLAVVRRSLSDDDVIAALDEVAADLDQTLADTQGLTRELNPPILHVEGFEKAVEQWLREHIEREHHMDTEFVDDGLAKPLDTDTRSVLLRHVKELLRNVVKHAQAQTVRVFTRKVGAQMWITVADDGIGFDAATVLFSGRPCGFGLFSIREQLEGLGGSLDIDSKPGRGCRAVIKIALGQAARLERARDTSERGRVG